MPPPDELSFDLTNDQRTVNNVVRHEYRVLTDDEKAAMKRVKDAGAALIAEIRVLASVEGTDMTRPPTHMSWELQNAHRAAEEAVMWATKHVTAQRGPQCGGYYAEQLGSGRVLRYRCTRAAEHSGPCDWRVEEG